MSPLPFDFHLRTRLVYGVGASLRAGELTRPLGASALLVVDPAIDPEPIERSLVEAGVAVRRWENVRENPSSSDCERCRAFAAERPPDVIVGLGGGSAIDLAKGCNFLLAGGGRMDDYRGYGKLGAALLPLVAIPTTAGTGTEVQSFALIEQDETHQKMACGAVGAAPRIALLDPALTVTMPRLVTATTGLDALGHAVESAVTTKRNAISDVFAREAFRLAVEALPVVLEAPEHLDARGAMLRAATFAGLAIENSMLGAAHSMANPLTARFGLAHGLAVGMTLPTVVRFNAQEPAAAAIYAELARAANLVDAGAGDTTVGDTTAGDAECARVLAARLDALVAEAGFPPTLDALGVPLGATAGLAAEAAQQWTAQFNPRPVDESAFRALFDRACGA